MKDLNERIAVELANIAQIYKYNAILDTYIGQEEHKELQKKFREILNRFNIYDKGPK